MKCQEQIRKQKFLSRIVSLCAALALTCNMFPMRSLGAEGPAGDTAQENAGRERQEGRRVPEGQETPEGQNMSEGQEDEEPAWEVIEINTAADFLAFADHCSLDAWSSNKLVRLNADIDLSGTGFVTIPVFTGYFDGQGHTISGFAYSGDGYVAGLFRYIEKGGIVENLRLEGEVIASEEKECIGGLCGVNFGTIKNCGFQGTVSGRTDVGGLVGVNQCTGVIQNSFAGGHVDGYYSTGGIVGKNHGILSYCTNRACINNDSEWVEEDDEMGVGIFLRVNISGSETKLFSGVDTGGIAGYSDGMITRCMNYGQTGYEHTGYNIGGIAGRQSGVVSSCTNAGPVYGRKDVGGIVGQMEPYIEVDEAASLRNAVNKLHDLIAKTIDDMEAAKNVIKGDLDDLAAYSDGAADAGDALAGQMTDFVNENMDQIQAVTERLEHVMDMLPEVFDAISRAEDSFSDANSALMQIADDLRGSVSGGDAEPVNTVLGGPGRSQPDHRADDIGSAIKEQQDAIDRVNASIQEINAILQEIQDSPNVSPEQLKELTEALEEMSDAMAEALGSLSEISNIAGPKLEDMGNNMTAALNCLQEAVDSIRSASRAARSIVDYVNGQPDLHFSKLGGAFDASRESLHGSLRGMSDSIKELSGNASDYSEVVNDDLRAVNDQINVVFNLLADNLTGYGDISVEELYEDVDIEDIAGITTGKVSSCTNKGIVQGDINVGGIAGAMSIDEEDPEGSAAGSVEYQIGGRYFTKCIITDSVNEGYVTAKKDGAGGIVGYMRHGIVVDSEGYGSVESTEGDYVGGICGESFTVIKRCYALCSVSGGRNVGGIAGFADTLMDCYAIVDCNAAAGRMGAIAGQIADYDDGPGEEVKVRGNYYVDDGLYGIDNISYAGAAEPISYEELLATAKLPTQFRHLKVIFRVEDLYLGVQEVKFGESLSGLEYPRIPEKEGYYGVWPDCSDRVMAGNLLIKGEYKEDVTVVQSSETQASAAEGGRERPYALVEQRFTEDTVLSAAISHGTPPERALHREYVIYDITLENARIQDTDTFAVRLYNPYGAAEVWGYKDGIWSELESKSRGQYLQADMTGAEQSFCVIEQKSQKWILIACAAGGLAVLALPAAVVKKSKAGRTGRKGREK